MGYADRPRYFWVLLVAALAVLAGGCPGKKSKYPLCGTDKDCKEGEYCVEKECKKCGDDSHCGAGQSCEDGACVTAKNACVTDDDCGDDKVCKDNRCVACESDGECGPGGKCNAGACERPKKCSVDEDCEDDEDCLNGRCQKPWQGGNDADATCKLETVYFGFDEWTIAADQRDLVSANGECIRKEGERGVYLQGHTDESGTEEYNIALSERRANAVADFLARLGLDPARMSIVPMGEAQPSGQGDDRDRRVEFNWK